MYVEDPDAVEVPLPRGDVTEGVVRVGGTVRRPHQAQSEAVAGYLRYLEEVGFDGSPRYLGRDRQGRDVLTYLAGDVAGDPPDRWAAADDLLASVATLVRRLHTASAGYTPPADAVWRRGLVLLDPPIEEPVPELVSHLDVTPQNVVVRDGRATGLIDFDLAGPTTRLNDVFNTAMHWVPLRPAADVWPTWPGIDRFARLRRFADAYGLTDAERAAFTDCGTAGADRSWRRMKASAEQLGGGWARMWAEGVGDAIRGRQRWLADRRENLLAALLE